MHNFHEEAVKNFVASGLNTSNLEVFGMCRRIAPSDFGNSHMNWRIVDIPGNP
ncbi:MAG: hypothetical protein R3E01_35640 [Pirellulaceae bacterium]|nr:hypothetical protein [Planctomycetales bacterium]